MPFACVDGGGGWHVTNARGPWANGFAVCGREFPGSRFAVPPNGYRNELIREARPASASGVWLNYRQVGDGWTPNLLPPR
jgi:hypothetical protein